MTAVPRLARATEPPTLADVRAIVAPLVGQLRVELDPADREGWIDQLALGEPSAGPLADLNGRFVAAGFGANRRAVAASLLLRYGWAAGFSIGAWLTCGLVPRIGDFALKFSSITLVEAIWVRQADFVVPSSAEAGRHALAKELYAFSADLVEGQHRWSGFSRHALWAMITSSWAAQFTAIGERLGQRQDALEQAKFVINMDARIAGAAPHLYEVKAGGLSQVCQRRAACCLYFKGPRRHFCASCPIIPTRERLERNRSWVQANA